MAITRRRRAFVLLLWLAALLAGGAVIARSQFSADLSAFLPEHPDAQQRVLIEQLRSGSAARTLLIGIEGGDAAARAAASRTLAAALRASPLFEQIENGERESWQAAGQWLFRHRYLLSPAVSAERYTVAGLRDAIDETLSLLGTPAGQAIKPLIDRDPTGEMQRIAETLIPANAPRSEDGVWISRDSPRALLLGRTSAAGDDLDGLAVALGFVEQQFAPHTAQGLQLRLSGPPLFAVQSRARIEREAKQLALAGSLVIGALLLLAFRSPRALGVALLPVATGVVCGISAVGLVFGTVHGMTLGFGSTLIGETVDYAIYYLIQARGAGSTGNGWRRWREQNWPTVRLGLLTSVCGFAALVFSGFPGLAQLGVFSIAGLIGAALATRYVLPVLAPDGAPGQGLRRPMARVAGGVIALMPRLRWATLAFGALALGLLVAKGGSAWSGDLASLSPVSTEAQQLDSSLRADLGASDARTLVVAQGPDAQAALRSAEAAAAALETLVAQGKVLGFDTPTRVLPSIATQQDRLAALPDADSLRDRLAVATAGGPLPASRLAPFIDDVQAARKQQPLRREDLEGSALASLVDAMMFERPSGGWLVLLALQPPPAGIDIEAVRAALQTVPGAQVIDVKHALDSLYSGYLHEAFAQAALGALAVVALLALYLRSARRLLAVCQPLVLAVLLTAGALVALGVGLSILHLVGLLLVVAVGSNYALFFDQLRRHGQVDDDTLASLLLANLTTVVSFGLIALSQIPPLAAIGRVVAPGALLALLLAAAFAPSRRLQDLRSEH